VDTSHQEQIERALASSSPVEGLRAYAMDLSSQGLHRSEITKIFKDYYKILQDTNRQKDEDILGDVLDMLTGWYSGRNLELPD
jgi:hypothetical protein